MHFFEGDGEALVLEDQRSLLGVVHSKRGRAHLLSLLVALELVLIEASILFREIDVALFLFIKIYWTISSPEFNERKVPTLGVDERYRVDSFIRNSKGTG